MTDRTWELGYFSGSDDRTVIAVVCKNFNKIYREHFSNEFHVNHELPIEVRAFRRSNGWCVFLLLTPWMMARVFIAEHDPGLSIPSGWSAGERTGAPFLVIGPQLEFTLLGETLTAHLNYLPGLGHFLLQPLVQSMGQYTSASAVFAAWDEVIKVRDRVMEEKKHECSWQKEISRREFLGFLRG